MNGVLCAARQFPPHPTSGADFLDGPGFAQVVQADEDASGKVGTLFAIGLGIKALLAHRPDRHVIGRDFTLLAEEFVAAPGELVAAEEGRAHRDAALGREVLRFRTLGRGGGERVEGVGGG